MKFLLFFFSFLFVPLILSDDNYSNELVFLEISKNELPSIAFSHATTPDQKTLFISTINNEVLIYDLSSIENTPTLLKTFQTYNPLHYLLLVQEKYLIGIGSNNISCALEIYEIKNDFNLTTVKIFELLQWKNEIKSFICLNSLCTIISSVDSQLGIKFINITNKDDPTEIIQSEILKNYTIAQALVTENEIIASFDDNSTMALLNISDLLNVQLISSHHFQHLTSLSAYNGTLIFLTCENAWTGKIYQWFTQDLDNVNPEWFTKWLKVEIDGELIPYILQSPKTVTCSVVQNDASLIKVYERFTIVFDWPLEFLNLLEQDFYRPYPYDISDLDILHNDYVLIMYYEQKYFQISYLFNRTNFEIPYSLVKTSLYYPPDVGNQALLVVGADSKKFLIAGPTDFGHPCYYSLKNPKEPVFQNYINYTDDYVFSTLYLHSDSLKRFFMIFTYHYNYDTEIISFSMLVYDYNFENTTCKGMMLLSTQAYQVGFVVFPIQFGDLLYLYPNHWNVPSKLLEYLIVVNISDPSNLTYEETNVPSGTGRKKSGATGCYRDGERIIFKKTETDSNIYIYKISNENYKELILISRAFVQFHLGYFQTSDDCNYLFAGGEAFVTINLKDLYNPEVISILRINDIIDLRKIKNKIYVMLSKMIYIFDVSKGYPVLVSSAAHPLTDEKYKVGSYRTDILETELSNYIYKGSHNGDAFGGKEISIYQEKKLFYIYLNQSKSLVVGVPITYRYYGLNIEDMLETKGIIYSIYLTNTSASFPAITSIPSWVSFDFNAQIITLEVPKNYQYEELNLLFQMRYPLTENPGIYQQVIKFPKAKSSLNYTKDPYIIISTPSKNTLNIILNHKPDIKFIFLTFASVFTSYSYSKELGGSLAATGALQPINEMLKNLRYTFVVPNTGMKYEKSFNLSIKDNLNNDIFDSNIPYDENTFRINQPPNCSIENFQAIIDSQAKYVIPLSKFAYEINSEYFSDPEGDLIYYSLSSQNSNYLPNWLAFDSLNLRLSGTPPIEDQGILLLNLEISDNYDHITRNFSLNISDNPPQLIHPLNKQLSNQIAKVGKDFEFRLNLQTFKDEDGPYDLKYSVFIIDMNHPTRFHLTSSSNYWLHFDDSLMYFSGIPEVADCNDYGNNVTVNVSASDGVKTTSDIFVIQVFPSLVFNNDGNKSFPFIEYLEDSKLTCKMSISQGKIIILNDFIFNNSNLVSYSKNANMSEIEITTTAKILNQAYNYIIYTSTNQNRLLQEELDINYVIFDDKKQNISGKINNNLLTSYNKLPNINREYISNEYLAEIGTILKISISKNILISDYVKNMRLNYSLELNSSNDMSQNWIFLQSANDNLEIFTTKSVDASLLGKYKGKIIITDEFDNKFYAEFTVDIDYSNLDKFKNYLQLISSIVGPLISLFAFSKFFYLVYNLIWRKRVLRKDYFLNSKNKFKIKIPLIEQEWIIGYQLFELIEKEQKSINKNYFKLFLNEEILNKPIPLAHQNEFLQAAKHLLLPITSEKNNTVMCVAEGLLIKHLVETLPNGSKFLRELEAETNKTGASDVEEWYNEFFFDIKLSNEKDLKEMTSKQNFNDLKISNYVLQNGIYGSLEKNLYVMENFYDFVFEKTLAKFKKKKFTENEIAILKPLILRAIIQIKRGIPFFYGKWSFRLNDWLSIFGFRILPFNFGDAVHLLERSEKHITAYQEINNNEKIFNVKNSFLTKITSKVKNTLFPYEAYFAINEKNFPNWLNIEFKKGYIKLWGCPYIEEYKKIYIIRITSRQKFNILQFRFVITDIDHSIARSNSISKRAAARKSKVSLKSSQTEESKRMMNIELKKCEFIRPVENDEKFEKNPDEKDFNEGVDHL